MSREQIFVIGGVLGSLILIVGFAIVYNNFQYGDPSKLLNGGRFLHWHAEISANVCGQEQIMPKAGKGGEVGSGPIHTHEDGLVHMEGVFKGNDAVAVNKYLLSVGIPFSGKGIYSKTDGSPCSGNQPESTASSQSAQAKHLHGTVNGKEVPDILHYSMRDHDKIRLLYD